jgi:hypothetical protein
MFDDLRQQAAQGPLGQPEEEEQDVYAMKETPVQNRDRLLGMTPVQRFVIAIMLLMMTLILSSLCLLVTEKIYLPF